VAADPWLRIVGGRSGGCDQGRDEPPAGFLAALDRDRVHSRGRVAAMAFQFASTNLVIELGIILAVLIGWQFVAAEFAGGLIMVALLTVMLRGVMTQQRIAEAKRQAERGLVGRMEGHAAMDMSVTGDGSRIALLLLGVSYAAMAVAAYIVELMFGAAGLVPQQRSAQIVEAHITWNYTTWLNIVFLGLAAVLVWRFNKTGGPAMLRMMNQPGPTEAHLHS
jgi:uncharacterized membrane protein YraQ (UPF0718 family)